MGTPLLVPVPRKVMRIADNVFKYDYVVTRNLINRLKFTEKFILKCPVYEMKKKH
jgi:hypothetical protein